MIINSKKGVVKWVRSSAGIAIMFAIFGSILLYLFLVPPEIREQILPPVETNYEETIFDVRPGLLSYVDEVWKAKSLRLNDIELDNTLSEQKHIVSNNFEISSTAFNQYDSSFRFFINKSNAESAALEFIVYSKEGDGNLEILLNGKSIHSSKVNIGDNLKVELPFHDLNNGENSIIMSTTAPGAKFWSTNAYTLLNFNLVTEEYSSRLSSGKQVFSLTDSEAANAENVKIITYIVRTSDLDSNVALYLNGRRLYKAVPQTNFNLDISEDLLIGGANTFEWTVDREGGYSIKQAILTMDTVKTKGKQSNYIFNIDKTRHSYIEKNYYNCNLIIERESGGDTMIANINSEPTQVTFSSEIVTLNICDDLKEGRNTIRFYTEDDDISLARTSLRIETE